MALRIDAATDILSRTTNLPAITAFTMMGWFRIAVDRNALSTFLSFGNSAAAPYYSAVTGADGVTLNLYNGSVFYAGTVLEVAGWYHIALVVSGTGTNQAKVYLSGVSNITGDGNASVLAEKMWAGGAPVSTDWLNGRVAAVFVYDAVLTADEIARQRHFYFPRRTANLKAWMPCFNVALQGVDHSGNGDWTVGGTLATEDGPPIRWGLGSTKGLRTPRTVGQAAVTLYRKGVRWCHINPEGSGNEFAVNYITETERWGEALPADGPLGTKDLHAAIAQVIGSRDDVTVLIEGEQ